MDNLCLLLVILVVSLADQACAEFCTDYNYWNGRYSYSYCTFGCCGHTSNQYCCTTSAGAIVGIVIGGISAVAIVVSIICCCVKQHNHRGQVIQQAPGTTTIVGTHTHSNVFVVPPGGSRPAYPPAYPAYYNSGYDQAERPGFPAPPNYSQPGLVVPPAYGHPGTVQPPTYSQIGTAPPTYNQIWTSPLTQTDGGNHLPGKHATNA